MARANAKQGRVAKQKRFLDNHRPKDTGRDALYLRADCTEFLDRYVDPELKRIYGVVALRAVRTIDIHREITIPGEDGITRDYMVTVQKDATEGIPLSATVSVTERRQLTDPEMIIHWPLLEAHGVVEDIKDVDIDPEGSLVGAAGIDPSKVMDEDVQTMMKLEAETLGQMNCEEEDISTSIYTDPVFILVRRALTVSRNQRPVLVTSTAYLFAESEYLVQFDGWASPSLELVGDNLDEFALFAGYADDKYFSVEQEDGSEFVRALDLLGFRPARPSRKKTAVPKF